MSPKITIVIPIYNGTKYIKRCLESVLQQSFIQFEVLCIDDGSTDFSYKIVNSFIKDDKRVRLIRNKANMGLSYTKNLGISKAHGEYIGFVDCDDTIQPDMFEKLYDTIVNSNTDISLCNFNYLDQSGLITHQNLRLKADYNKEDIFRLNLENYISSSSCIMLVKRSLFIKNKITFPVNRFYEDSATSYKIFYFAKSISINQEPLYNYFNNQGSITNNIKAKNNQDILLNIEEFKEFLIKEGILDKYKQSFYIRVQSFINYQLKKIQKAHLKPNYKLNLLADLFNKISNSHTLEFKHYSIHLVWLHLAFTSLDKGLFSELLLKIPNYLSLITTPELCKYIELMQQSLGLSAITLNKLEKAKVTEVYIYGAGEIAEKIIPEIEKIGIKIQGIFDSNMEKDQILMGYSIEPFNIKRDLRNIVVASESSAYEITKSLYKKNSIYQVFNFYQ